MNKSTVANSENDPERPPLSRRTEQRLANMARFTRQVANSSIGYDEKSMAMESAVHALGQLLVAQLRERESRSESP